MLNAEDILRRPDHVKSKEELIEELVDLRAMNKTLLHYSPLTLKPFTKNGSNGTNGNGHNGNGQNGHNGHSGHVKLNGFSNGSGTAKANTVYSCESCGNVRDVTSSWMDSKSYFKRRQLTLEKTICNSCNEENLPTSKDNLQKLLNSVANFFSGLMIILIGISLFFIIYF